MAAPSAGSVRVTSRNLQLFLKNDKCIYIGCLNSITLVRLAGGSGAYPVSVEGNVMSRDLFKNGVQ